MGSSWTGKLFLRVAMLVVICGMVLGGAWLLGNSSQGPVPGTPAPREPAANPPAASADVQAPGAPVALTKEAPNTRVRESGEGSERRGEKGEKPREAKPREGKGKKPAEQNPAPRPRKPEREDDN